MVLIDKKQGAGSTQTSYSSPVSQSQSPGNDFPPSTNNVNEPSNTAYPFDEGSKPEDDLPF